METKIAKERNILIDIIKLLMALIIVIYHYNYMVLKWSNGYLLKGGYLCVDIFFVISGFYCIKIILNNKDENIVNYIKRRLKPIYSYYIVALILAVINSFLIAGSMEHFFYPSRKEALFKEILLIQEWGTKIDSNVIFYNPITWYISAQFFVSLLWFVLFSLKNRKWSYFTMIVIFLCAAVWVFKNGNLHFHGTDGRLALGLIRGIFDMSIGAIAYFVYTKWQLKNKILASILLCIGLLVFIYVVCIGKDSAVDYLVLIAGFLMIYSTECLKVTVKKDAWKIFGKLSLAIYLIHLQALNLIGHLRDTYSLFEYVLLSFLVAIIIVLVQCLIEKRN